jgi:hypothetical protein
MLHVASLRAEFFTVELEILAFCCSHFFRLASTDDVLLLKRVLLNTKFWMQMKLDMNIE